MNLNVPPFVAAVGRLLLALMFVMSGLSKLAGLQGAAALIASKGLPVPMLLAVLSALLETLGGIALVVGWHARSAALLLALFTLLASVIFHNFWAAPPAQAMVQQLMFMKNIAVTGGLLFVLAVGAGPASLDSRRRI